MPVNSISFNRFLLLLTVLIAPITAAFGQIPHLDSEQRKWLGDKIYANECASQFSCLTSWNEGEDFPSLGIGHFIWFQSGQEANFDETFPALIDFYNSQNISLPNWIQELHRIDSPWQNRQQFYREIDSDNMQELRQFLEYTRDVQVDFIIKRLDKSIPPLLADLDPSTRDSINKIYQNLATSENPYGIYALIDYVHFKGVGTNPAERYQGEGWGLRQVLEQMQGQTADLDNFIAAAGFVLERRVRNAPVERREERWLKGWKNRLQTYRPER